MLIKNIYFSSALCILSSSLFAQGIVLNNEDIRSDLNWLHQQGVIQISTSTWPMSGDEIRRALEQAQVKNRAQQKVIDSVQTALDMDNKTVKVGLFAASGEKHLPQQFAANQTAELAGSLELNAGGESWDARLRVNAEDQLQIDSGNKLNVEGTYLAGKLYNQWLIAGQIPSYWGPGHDGSLIRGDASRPVYGFTAQRAQQQAFESKWLSWIGPWQYQAFAGQLDHYQSTPHAKLLGLRLTAQPLPYFELGASRVLQWGGEGRSESWDSLWNAIKGNDNFDHEDEDKSNQLAGFDARLNLQQWTRVPVSLYGQYVGEDESGMLPAKKMYLFGTDYSSSYRGLPYQLYAEWADTRCNGKVNGVSYNHYVYHDGYYQHGAALGHGMGGDGEMYSVGGNIRVDSMNRLAARVFYANVNQSHRSTNAAFPEQDKLTALDLTWTHYIQSSIPVKINGWISDSDRHGHDSGVSLRVEMPLDKKVFGF